MNSDFFNIPHTFKLLSTQTKARRLGYLTLIIEIIKENQYYPITSFANKLEIEAQKINYQLEEYKTIYNGDDKGIIKITSTGISANYYIKLAEGLKLLTRSNRTYILSKQGKLFSVLLEELSKDRKVERNIFKLSLLERLYYILQILINDPIYSFTLLELLYNKQDTWIDKNLRDNFYNIVVKNLKTIKYSEVLTKREKNEIDTTLQRVENWREKEKYLEHIIEPRVNWFLDLGFLDNDYFRNNKLRLSSIGEKYYLGLKNFYNQYKLSFLINDFIAKNNFFNFVNTVFDLEADEFQDLNKLNQNIEIIIKSAFDLFKTIAPNRINAYQTIYYICFSMLINDKKIVEFNNIKNLLIVNKKFSLEWFNSEDDGSLKLFEVNNGTKII